MIVDILLSGLLLLCVLISGFALVGPPYRPPRPAGGRYRHHHG